MAKVDWTAEAEAWLKRIHDHIAENSPEAAFRTVVDIYKRTQILAAFPELGQRLPHRSKRHIRVLVLDDYRVAYVIKQSGDLDVIGVFHGSMDILRHLK